LTSIIFEKFTFFLSFSGHDESTFRSGDVSAERWTIDDQTPFFNKGRGRSHMVSDFLVAHPSGPFFALTHSEYKQAVEAYPHLSTQNDLSFVGYSATAGINVGHDSYFDSNTVLQQFERLFQLLPFKQDFQGHDIEILVDNARTHSAKEYSINDFGKGIGTRCPVQSLEFLDDRGMPVRISCYFSSGDNKGKSKGLLVLAKELKLPVQDSMRLGDLINVLATHQAFQNVSLIQNCFC